MKMIPTPRILLSERNKDWKIAGAISELIDNSLGADRGNADHVWIYWDAKSRTLVVLDDGRGMKEVSYLFQLGQGVTGTKEDIGLYGQGGSSALLWLSDWVSVHTVRDGQRSYTGQDIHQTVDINADWLDVTDTWTPATPNNVPKPLNQHPSGTQISMLLRDGKRMYPDVIQRELSKTYAAGLRKGKRIIWVNGLSGKDAVALRPWEPGDLLNVDEFEVEVRGMRATVKAGIGEDITQRDAGMSVTFGHRQIMKTRDPLNGWDGGKLYGWVDLSSDWRDHLTNNKTGIADEELWSELMEKVHEGIKPLLDLLDQEAEQEFAAQLSLEANLQFGAFVKRQFPDPKGWTHHEDPRPRKGHGKSSEPNGGIPIHITPDRSLEGRIMHVVIHVGDKVAVRYDPESELMIEAKQSRPLNRLLMRSLIADEFAAAMIRQNLVVDSGLYRSDEWEQLQQDCAEDQLMVAAFVKPRLFKVIGEMNKVIA